MHIDSNIIHFPSATYKRYLFEIDRIVLNSILKLPEDITIITMFTDKSKAILCNLLEKANIKYINALENIHIDLFIHCNKVKYYIDALDSVTTKYALVIDAYDTVILSFDRIIEKFNDYNCDILFNACNIEYPCNVDLDDYKIYNSTNLLKYMNSGVCFGYTNKIKQLFLSDIDILNDTIKKPSFTELYFLRKAIIKEHTKINVNIDYNSTISFICINNIMLSYKDSNLVKNDFLISLDSANYMNDFDVCTTEYSLNLTELKFLYKLVLYFLPNQVLEFGSGLSTMIFDLLCKDRYLSIDNDVLYIDDKYKDNIIILKANINDSVSYYEDLMSNIRTDIKYDFIFIDGPYCYLSQLPRTNIIDLIKARLINDKFAICLHDSNRNGEKNLICNIKLCLLDNEYTTFKFFEICIGRGMYVIYNK